MSEVGKQFDRILDYKIREDNRLYFKPDTPKAVEISEYNFPVNKSVTWEDLVGTLYENNSLEVLKERKDIYDYEVCRDEPNDIYISPIAPINYIIIPIKHIKIKCVINRDGPTFSELIEQYDKPTLESPCRLFVAECGSNDLDAKVCEGDVTMEMV